MKTARLAAATATVAVACLFLFYPVTSDKQICKTNWSLYNIPNNIGKNCKLQAINTNPECPFDGNKNVCVQLTPKGSCIPNDKLAACMEIEDIVFLNRLIRILEVQKGFKIWVGDQCNKLMNISNNGNNINSYITYKMADKSNMYRIIENMVGKQKRDDRADENSLFYKITFWRSFIINCDKKM